MALIRRPILSFPISDTYVERRERERVGGRESNGGKREREGGGGMEEGGTKGGRHEWRKGKQRSIKVQIHEIIR